MIIIIFFFIVIPIIQFPCVINNCPLFLVVRRFESFGSSNTKAKYDICTRTRTDTSSYAQRQIALNIEFMIFFCVLLTKVQSR